MKQTHLLFSSSIQLDDFQRGVVNTAWFAQANRCISEAIRNGGKRYQYGVIDMLVCLIQVDTEFHHILHQEGISQEAHIFLGPVGLRRQGLRLGIDFPVSDHFYWSLDASGSTRMTQDECDAIGLPRLNFSFLSAANFWQDYHYNAIREFFEAKRADPYGSDVTQFLGLPLVEMESAME
ncbi:hypothetical protein B0H14DRAFT_78270 [Mycena olivaceomarginata]|nr:hypothetical protein B0H14DRAFT_78270 [Mycena olivaceomarginata]